MTPYLPVLLPPHTPDGCALRVVARARELVDQDTPIDAACHIVIREDQLDEVQRINGDATASSRRPLRPEVARFVDCVSDTVFLCGVP
ncbi:hypothetical protein ACIF6I_35840 [Streptomyces microflavus]|uniref:hypothetical protein n=1 Tax=Streptomyces microflavus TaxID=1919 RepID=UPI0037D92190